MKKKIKKLHVLVCTLAAVMAFTISAAAYTYVPSQYWGYYNDEFGNGYHLNISGQNYILFEGYFNSQYIACSNVSNIRFYPAQVHMNNFQCRFNTWALYNSSDQAFVSQRGTKDFEAHYHDGNAFKVLHSGSAYIEYIK